MYVWLGQFQKRFLLLLFFKWTLWEKRFCGGKNNLKKLYCDFRIFQKLQLMINENMIFNHFL